MKLGRLVLASLILCAPAVASAHDVDDDPGQAKKAKKAKKARKHAHKKVRKLLRKFDRAISRLDQDGDGRLGPDEAGDRFARFQRFDLDGDGWVTREEIIVFMKDRAKARKARRAQRLDAP